MRLFWKYIMIFSCLIMINALIWMCIAVWLLVSWMNYRGKTCSVPLDLWCIVEWSLFAYRLLMGGGLQRATINCICGWQPDPNATNRVPMRVTVTVILLNACTPIWDLVGLCWAATAGGSSSEHPPCTEVASPLVVSVGAYAGFQLYFSFFMVVNMVGLNRLLRAMLRRGMLHSSQAAPKGAIEASTEVITFSNPEVAENPSCSICLEDYTAESVMVKTKACDHIFHKACLQDWFKVSRYCPLCRGDLGRAPV